MDVAVELGEYNWLERLVNILQIRHFCKTFSVHFYESYNFEDTVNFDISNALGQN